jgi:hypothetical protein
MSVPPVPLGTFVRVSFNRGGEAKRVWWKPWKRRAVWITVGAGVITDVSVERTLNGPGSMTFTATDALASLLEKKWKDG